MGSSTSFLAAEEGDLSKLKGILSQEQYESELNEVDKIRNSNGKVFFAFALVHYLYRVTAVQRCTEGRFASVSSPRFHPLAYSGCRPERETLHDCTVFS